MRSVAEQDTSAVKHTSPRCILEYIDHKNKKQKMNLDDTSGLTPVPTTLFAFRNVAMAGFSCGPVGLPLVQRSSGFIIFQFSDSFLNHQGSRHQVCTKRPSHFITASIYLLVCLYRLTMGLISYIESKVGDLDDLFAYSTNPTVRIRDRYLGILAYGARVCVIFYIVFYQLIIRKSYQVQTPVDGSCKVTPTFPSANERWPNGGPYCIGVDSSSFPPRMVSGYARVDNTTYARGAGPLFTRLPCTRWDEADYGAISVSLASDFIIPT